MSKTALVFGAETAIGQACLQTLIADDSYERVTLIQPTPTQPTHSKVRVQALPFERIEHYPYLMVADQVFFCLDVDVDRFPVRLNKHKVSQHFLQKVANMCLENTIQQFLVFGHYSNNAYQQLQRVISASRFPSVIFINTKGPRWLSQPFQQDVSQIAGQVVSFAKSQQPGCFQLTA